MNRLNAKAIIINLVILAAVFVLAGLTWWNSERMIPVAGGLSFPPGSKVVKEEITRKTDEIQHRYVVERRGGPEEVEAFFLKELDNDSGWKLVKPKEDVYVFSKEGEFARLVIHEEKKKTRYTFNYRKFQK